MNIITNFGWNFQGILFSNCKIDYCGPTRSNPTIFHGVFKWNVNVGTKSLWFWVTTALPRASRTNIILAVPRFIKVIKLYAFVFTDLTEASVVLVSQSLRLFRYLVSQLLRSVSQSVTETWDWCLFINLGYIYWPNRGAALVSRSLRLVSQ